MSVIVDSVERLTARIYHSVGWSANAAVEWSSADPGIASVGRTDGVVTAISAGSTTITVATGGFSATAGVSVFAPGPFSLTISSLALSLIAGSVERLTTQAYDGPGRKIDASVEWSSGDAAIASVGEDGLVTAIAGGTTTVTAAVGAIRAMATVSVLDVAGTVAFTRMTWADTNYVFDVLTYSSSDRAVRSLPRPVQFGSIASPAWSPDGTQLAVEVIHRVIILPDDEGFYYDSDVYVLDATDPAGSPWRALTANGRSGSPSWSPDGTRIAYIAPSTVDEGSDIYVVNVRGGQPVRLTRTAGNYGGPRWSPDGTRLVFADFSYHGEIFIVNADGSGLTNVTQSNAYDADPSWSPDGARLAFTSDRAGSAYRPDVFIVDVDGTNITRLTSDSFFGWTSGPVWSPDGRQIMFSRMTYSQNPGGIFVVSAGGSSVFQLTRTPPGSWDSAPAWRR